MKKTGTLVALLLLVAGRLMAVPAYPDLVKFKQPHSDVVLSILLMGDERVHWAESADGYSLVHGDDGTLMFATRNGQDMVPSSYPACEIEDRDEAVKAFLEQTPKHLRYSKSQIDALLNIWNDMSQMRLSPKTMSNVIGEKRFLVILFAYQDLAFTHSLLEFNQLFNQVNYSVGSSIGSVHDYYYDVSHGLFSLNVDVVGPYTGDHNMAYYGTSSADATHGGYQAFAEEAVRKASQDVDFSNYDNDGDGYIDGLHIIFAGHGEEAGAGADAIWSHKWNINRAPTYNNTVVNVYSCSPECSGSSGTTMTAIGVICHELGHVLGAPDYYDTDYESYGQYPGLGQWDIMSSGSWNNSGYSPAHHNPYTKAYIYKWIQVDTLSEDCVVKMRSVADTNSDVYRINTSTPDDFFLLENRQKKKWDRYTPGHGLLVYHKHRDAYGDAVANNRHPQQLYIVTRVLDSIFLPQNDPDTYGSISNNYCTLPGDGRRDSLTDYTHLALRPWSGNLNHTPLYNIQENTFSQTIYFCFGNAQPSPTSFVAEGSSNASVFLNWESYGSYNVMILMSQDETFGTPTRAYRLGDTVDGGGRVVYQGNNMQYAVQNLESNTTYHFRLYMKQNDSTYVGPLSAEATTLSCEATQWRVENFDTLQSALPACWSGDDWAPATGDNGQKYIAGKGRLGLAPFAMASNQPAVLTFSSTLGEMSEGDTLYVQCRPSMDATWTTLQYFTRDNGNDSSAWQTQCVKLNNVSEYTQLAFEANCEAPLKLDDVRIDSGYVTTITCGPHGSISPDGQIVRSRGDTVTFIITPQRGYEVDRMMVGTRRAVIRGDRVKYYQLAITGEHEVSISFVRSSAIDEATASESRLYPNPTTDVLHVETAVGTPIAVLDMMGRKVIETEADAEIVDIDFRTLPRGTYLLICGTEQHKVVKL
ncbi:MAG: M6 family metalloprotease domain-containing protein [Bacteroidales bacterium]|nr:M6 family metalloprotease domain-containing protein [Bacteroidales bacterium]